MFTQAKLLKYFPRIGGHNFSGGSSGVDCEQEGNEPAHDMCVAVTGKTEPGTALAGVTGFGPGGEPNLADTTLNLVFAGPIVLAQRFKGTPQLNYIAVAVFPIVKELEVGFYVFKIHDVQIPGQTYHYLIGHNLKTRLRELHSIMG